MPPPGETLEERALFPALVAVEDSLERALDRAPSTREAAVRLQEARADAAATAAAVNRAAADLAAEQEEAGGTGAKGGVAVSPVATAAVLAAAGAASAAATSTPLPLPPPPRPAAAQLPPPAAAAAVDGAGALLMSERSLVAALAPPKPAAAAEALAASEAARLAGLLELAGGAGPEEGLVLPAVEAAALTTRGPAHLTGGLDVRGEPPAAPPLQQALRSITGAGSLAGPLPAGARGGSSVASRFSSASA
jgi:hypothetical protein